jgi:hypothetical protein
MSKSNFRRDIVSVVLSMAGLVSFAVFGDTAWVLVSGFMLLFWQRELHNDFRREIYKALADLDAIKKH